VITENTLRTKIEVAADGQLKATLEGTAQSVEKIDKAQQAQAESASAAASAGQANATATQAVGESAAEAETRIRAMVQASLERQRAEQAQITASMRSVDTTKVATQTINEQVAAHQKAIAAADAYRERSAAASKAAGNTAGLDAQREAMHKLLGEIDPTVTSLDKLDKQQAKLAGFKKAGLLSDDDFARFNQAIDGSRNRITMAGEAMSHFNLNTAQTRRELGYLVKDLATGQWGRLSQSASTLAAQSGALSLVFSGLGVAVAATAGGLLAFAVAALQVYEEQQKLNRAIAQTGDYAGQTMGDINRMAESMAAAGTGKARDAMIALAGTGTVGRDAFESMGKAAVNVSILTGESADRAAASVVKMFDGTVAGALRANEQYHFLNASIVEQIRALEDAGDKQGAMKVAAEAFTNSTTPRIQTMAEQTYGLAAAWDEAGKNIGTAWENFKGYASVKIGTAGYQAQLDAVNARLTSPQSLVDRLIHPREADLDERDRLQAIVDRQQSNARRDAADTARGDAGAQGANTLDAIIKAGRTNEQKRADELIAAHDAANAAIRDARARNDDALVAAIREKETKSVELINAKYAPKGHKAPDLSIDTSVPSLDKTIEGYQKELDAQAKVTVGLQDYRQVQEAKLQTAREAYDLQVASIGMSDREIALEREKISIHREADADLQRLNKQRASMTTDQYDAQLSTIKEFENARVEAAEHANQRTLQAMGNWRHGMDSALKNYADSAADVAGQTKDMFTNAFDGMGDSLANFVTTGKGGFKGLVDSIIKDLIRMESRILVSQVLQSVLGAFMGSYGAEGTNTFSSIGTDSSGGNINFVSQVGGHAGGGRIEGPGTGTSDSILMYGSNGENVITASATDYYGQSFMDALNAKQVPRFAGGGRVGGGGGAGGMGGMEVVVNITNQGQAVQAQQTGARMDGQKMIIDMVLQAVQSDIAKGGGTAKVMQQRFGLTRRGVPVGG
jgi:lambda family phage tail tape measure protein